MTRGGLAGLALVVALWAAPSAMAHTEPEAFLVEGDCSAFSPDVEVRHAYSPGDCRPPYVPPQEQPSPSSSTPTTTKKSRKRRCARGSVRRVRHGKARCVKRRASARARRR